ncbi:MAG: endonuclease III [Candidatus Omnitrophica bacterium]|nr:endonuclease III [Candidatus Omnitrophota bacterium]
MNTQDRIRKILGLLDKAYGAPASFAKDDPVDVLIRTVLSQNTTDKNSLKAFAEMKKVFKRWDGALAAGTRRIAGIIKHAGLANIKAARIKDILAEIKRREGKIILARLAGLDVESALGYLESLKGVGPKTAACVLLFGFGRPVMPVDTHIFRVAKRLGLIDRKAGIGEAHEALTNIVPKHLIYGFHLGIIEHGRRTCKSQTPKCGVCVVYGLCKFRRKEYFKKRHLK